MIHSQHTRCDIRDALDLTFGNGAGHVALDMGAPFFEQFNVVLVQPDGMTETFGGLNDIGVRVLIQPGGLGVDAFIEFTNFLGTP